MRLSLNPFTLEPCSISKTSYYSHREMSYAAQSNTKAPKENEPILHWESTQAVPYGCKTMQLFQQGKEECDDCSSEDESNIPALASHDFSDSDLSTGLEYDEFGEDPWDDLEFTTY
jgi:hypothetical protein